MEIESNDLQELIIWLKVEKGISSMNTEELKQYYEEFKAHKRSQKFLKVNESDLIK